MDNSKGHKNFQFQKHVTILTKNTEKLTDADRIQELINENIKIKIEFLIAKSSIFDESIEDYTTIQLKKDNVKWKEKLASRKRQNECSKKLERTRWDKRGKPNPPTYTDFRALLTDSNPSTYMNFGPLLTDSNP